MKKRKVSYKEVDGLPGRSQLNLWFHEYRNTNNYVDKRYYKNMLGRKLSVLAQDCVRPYHWANNQGDLLGAAFEGLAVAIQSFDNTKCDNFYFWANLCIKTKFGREKYSEKKWKDNTQGWEVVQKSNIEDVDFPEETIPDNSLDPEENLLRQELWDVIMKQLDNNSKEILFSTLGLQKDKPDSIRQIAKRLGISRNKATRMQRDVMLRVTKVYSTYANMAA